MNQEGNLCIIPARKASKRILNKNIKPFLGKPIIAYSIEAAQRSNLFSEIMVSTDDEGIAEIAREFGATVPFLRSAKNSDDYATTADVLIEVIEEYKKINKRFELFCCIYATAPFVTAAKLSEGLGLMRNNEFDSVFPVSAFSFPVKRSVSVRDGKQILNHPEFFNTRSQDLEPCYHDTGQFYWSKPEVVLEHNRLFTDNTGAIIVSELEAQDIDTENDWELAELKYKFLKSKGLLM
jgi:N-acylneuraminate cytidylyltransferase